jgi:hypothetical protein
MLAREVFSCFVHTVSVVIRSRAWVELYRSLLELVMQRSSFGVVDWPHCPFGRLVVPELVVSTGSGEFDPIQLNVAPRSSHLSPNMRAHSSSVRFIRVDKRVDLIAIGRRCDVVPVFTDIKISFFTVAET